MIANNYINMQLLQYGNVFKKINMDKKIINLKNKLFKNAIPYIAELDSDGLEIWFQKWNLSKHEWSLLFDNPSCGIGYLLERPILASIENCNKNPDDIIKIYSVLHKYVHWKGFDNGKYNIDLDAVIDVINYIDVLKIYSYLYDDTRFEVRNFSSLARTLFKRVDKDVVIEFIKKYKLKINTKNPITTSEISSIVAQNSIELLSDIKTVIKFLLDQGCVFGGKLSVSDLLDWRENGLSPKGVGYLYNLLLSKNIEMQTYSDGNIQGQVNLINRMIGSGLEVILTDILKRVTNTDVFDKDLLSKKQYAVIKIRSKNIREILGE